MDALDHSPFLQFRLGNSTNAVGTEIRVSSLNAAQAAQVLVAGLLPLCNEVGIGDLLLDAVLVQLPTDGFPPVEQVVDVARLLVVYLEYRPERLVYPFPLVRFGFR